MPAVDPTATRAPVLCPFDGAGEIVQIGFVLAVATLLGEEKELGVSVTVESHVRMDVEGVKVMVSLMLSVEALCVCSWVVVNVAVTVIVGRGTGTTDIICELAVVVVDDEELLLSGDMASVFSCGLLSMNALFVGSLLTIFMLSSSVCKC